MDNCSILQRTTEARSSTLLFAWIGISGKKWFHSMAYTIEIVAKILGSSNEELQVIMRWVAKLAGYT